MATVKKKKKGTSFADKIQEKFLDFDINDLRSAPPSKVSLNIVVGFDHIYKQIRFMRCDGLNFAQAVFNDYPFTERFLSDEFCEEFKNVFAEYMKEIHTTHSLACYVCLPDNAVVLDNVALPVMQKNKLISSLTTYLSKEYRQFKEMRFNRYIAGKKRQYVVYYVTAIRKNYLINLYKSMAINKAFSKGITYSGNAMVNAILQYVPQYRKKSFILLDIKADYTHVAVCIDGKTAGVTDFKLGTVHLQNDKVLQENMQYDHDVADLAIINAKEQARKKMLTVEADEDDLEEVALSVEQQLSEGINLNEMPNKEEQTVEENINTENKQIDNKVISQVLAENVAPDVNPIDYIMAEAIPENPDDVIPDEDINPDLLKEIQMARKKKIFARKMPRRLPKFMLRPTPETPEGFVYENFRMFIKWALLFNSQFKQKEYLSHIDTCLVNIDEQYNYLMDMANSEEEQSELKFVRVPNLGENVNGHLDLIGTLFLGVHNKRQNF